MTTLHKNFTKFASLMVAFGLMLGLAVTGCSDKDSDGGRVAEMANIAYNFAQLAGVTPKATEDAVAVVMTAFDADGKAVVAEQETSIIAEHKDVTPAELVGSKVYEGVAQVDTTAVKLVLTYLNADGDEMSSDVVNNVTVKDGAVIDFTNSEPEPTSGVTWNPADNKIKIAVGEVVPISATDVDGNLLDLYGDESAEGYLDYVEDPVGIKGVAPTPEGEPVILTLNALNEAGEVLDTKVYEITVTGEPAPAPVVVWNPAEADQTINVTDDALIITADTEAGEAYLVDLTTDDKEHISVEGYKVRPLSATAEPVTVTATAKDIVTGDVVGTKVYNITVTATPAPAIVWQPAVAAQQMLVGDKLTIFATSGEGLETYTVTLEIADGETHVSVADKVVTAVSATDAGNPATVTATATDKNGVEVGTMEYAITVK